jgi:hypothetical protein
MKRRRKSNGSLRAVNDHKTIERARALVLKRALKRGAITNAEARIVMGLPQVWYHLNLLAQAGVLRRASYNTWVPVKRRGRSLQRV